MKSKIFIILFVLLSLTAQEKFKINYEMAEKCVDWLEFINTGAEKKEIHKYFMDNIAGTEGCKTIIDHWSRFKNWNNYIFYDFISEAIGLKESDAPHYNDDGTLTLAGKKSMLWKKALEDPQKIRENIETMKSMNLEEKSLEIASKYLPAKAEFQNEFYVVFFGASNAFSVGDRNGFDILQLPKKQNGDIDEEATLELFAHELHHTGFNSLAMKKLEGVNNLERFNLIGILNAEGMATYFINKPFDRFDEWKNHFDPQIQQLGKEWEIHKENIDEYYEQAEVDILKNLNGEIGQEEIMENWMNGLQGKAYALGADMISVIEKYSGLKTAVNTAYDYRNFLGFYNAAAKKGNEQGDDLYVFSDELLEAVQSYK